jgi:sulfoquinovosyltransferase
MMPTLQRHRIGSSWLAFLLWLPVVSGSNNLPAEESSCPTNHDHVHDHDPSLHVAVLTEPSPITYMSGQSARFRILLQHLVENYPNDQVHLVTAEVVHPNPPSTCFDGKIPIHYTWGFRLPHYPIVTLACDVTCKVWRLACKQTKLDIIHVSSPGMLLFPAILVSRLKGIPLLASYHTHLPMYVRTYVSNGSFHKFLEHFVWKLLRIVHSFADVTVVTSPQMAEEFAAHQIPNVQVWPKGINTTQFHPDHGRRNNPDGMRQRMMGADAVGVGGGHTNNTGDDDDVLLLVYIGRLAKEKRLTDLKDILQTLNEEERNHTMTTTRLCFVGSGPQEDELREYFKDTPTTFMGRLDGVALSQAFASGDIFVMPSDSETLGFVVLESMASGVPVVAAKAGGLINLIQPGETGYLVQVGDIAAYVECIRELRSDPALYRQLAINGRRETERWSWHASMEYLRQTAYPQAIVNCSRRFVQRVLRWIGWKRA